MKTYSSEIRGPVALAREAANLYRAHREGVPRRVDVLMGELGRVESVLRERYGLALENLRVLDVGAGQQLLQAAYFAQRNRVTGIDLDVVVQGFRPLGYARMLRVNGPRRTAKTAARKALRIDRRYAVELMRQTGMRRWPRLTVLQMDATQLDFPDGSFDLVYSHSVLQSVPDPGAAVRETARVLAPGGVAYLLFQLYTSETGSLDPRIFSGRRAEIPLWSHLRPSLQDRVQGNAYLNKLRLDEWREIFARCMPGAYLELGQPARSQLEPEAVRLQSAGELNGYTLDELVTHRVVATWKECQRLPAWLGDLSTPTGPTLAEWASSRRRGDSSVTADVRHLRGRPDRR